jgi:hypothetical protein
VFVFEAAPKIPLPLDVDRGKLGGSLNEVLMDSLLRHRHELFRVENGIVRGVVAPITAARGQLRAALNAIGGPHLADLSGLPLAQLRNLEREIGTVMAGVETAVTSKLRAGLSEVARVEVAAQNALLDGAIPRAVGWKPWEPTGADIAALVDTPYHGSVWHRRLGRGAAEAEIKLAETARAARSRGLTGKGLDRKFGQIIGTEYQARVVATLRTESGRVANDALLASYRRNAQTVESVMVVETLDDLTCLVCAARDGVVLLPDADPIQFPPYHGNCRGFMAPVLKSWQDMGLDAEDLRPQERAAMDGRVPGTVTYSEWFKRQDAAFQKKYLGAPRYELYKSGKMKITDMVKDFQVIPLKDLPVGNGGSRW